MTELSKAWCRVREKARREDPDEPPFGVPHYSPEEMTRPALISTPAPPYTPDAFRARLQGRVRVTCVLTELGRFSECRIREAPGDMAQNILSTLEERWRYQPVLLNGRPIAVDLPLQFDLTPPAAEPKPSEVQRRRVPEGAEPPRPLSLAPLTYPREALEHCVEGRMIAACVIDRQGRVTSCRALRTLPYLERAWLEALMKSRFAPAMVNGEAVEEDYFFRAMTSSPGGEVKAAVVPK